MNMTQTALWLPRDMYETLKKAGGERGLGEEIRRLLQAALEEGAPSDQATGELLEQIKEIAELSLPAPWHTDPSAFQVFKDAVNALLLSQKPDGEANPETIAKFGMIWGQENLAAIGPMIAHSIRISHARDRLGEASRKKKG
jgi:hypothetical protein